ncbi:MAG: SDR family NAD(P)-dependent oxidoreductase [Myxococcales bacterium]|nr:SDR family NAD(P)-dependent oxidoreductase [Myxococcales bacterium]MDD9969349.1 SDR family NAD(P)-dependent oxidoreductase [Myxococcales bacterium]
MGVLSGKVAIVTGSGRGIGREIALMFGREGAEVVVNDLGANTDGSGGSKIADEVVAEIKKAGGKAVANYDSVATVEGGQGIFRTAIDTFGRCDILVNNAGILRDKTLYNMDEDAWDAVIAVHLKGHYCCTRPFARYIKDTKRLDCRIINFSSVSGLFGNFGQSNYGAAKSGIAGFSRVIAKELAKYRCTVNTISPGAATRMTIPLAEARGQKVDPSDDTRGPQQIAPVVTWLASERAADVNAQILHVSGGRVGIMQQPAVIRSFKSEALWSLDQLNQAIPQLVEAKQANEARAKDAGSPELMPPQ